MDVKKFIEDFADQFDDVEANELTLEKEFRNVEEWSSLTALSVIAMVDEEYEVVLKGEDITNSNTIEDIYKIVKSRI
ncbi:phosphopantetheine-binding protein [Marinifilum fragile]|uniref:phosphopantetheine-binding protein n=1 Tax=Marinifilum fragile TaxID=570161 RepID=UPI002AA77329|nr:phosphopantetheine-binding protein [Marinifilum fragile]